MGNSDRSDIFTIRDSDDSSDDEDEELTCGQRMKKFLLSFLMYILLFCYFISTLFLSYIFLSEILYVTFFPVIYEWLSIFSKSGEFHLTFSICAALSDFGLFFVLIYMSWTFIYKFIDIMVSKVKGTYVFMKTVLHENIANE